MINRAFLLLTLLALSATTLHAQNEWKFKTEDDGIKVYTRYTPESKFKAVKVNCTMHATLSQLVAIIMDIKGSSAWAYHTRNSVVLKRISPSELYYYSEVTVPWPVANRDFIAHLIVKQNPQTRVVTIDAPCIGDYIPPKPGIVRVMQSEGKWIMVPKTNDELEVEYTLSLDPGVNVPAWVINLFAAQGPMQIFKNLKAELLKPQYKHAELSYITN